jgi:hypothetical protein
VISVGVKARGQAIRDILRLQIKGFEEDYKLSLAEMYGIADYIDELENELDIYKAKTSNWLQRIKDVYAELELWK